MVKLPVLAKSPQLSELEQLCRESHVPIIEDDSASYIVSLITSRSVKEVLEIGTAWGYSASLLLENCPNISITSVDNNLAAHKVAHNNMLRFNDRLRLVLEDAYEYVPTKKFDLIFLDGPKGRLQELTLKFLPWINKGGALIVDNIFLRSAAKKAAFSPRHANLLEKVNEYRIFLDSGIHRHRYEMIATGDGLALLWK